MQNRYGFTNKAIKCETWEQMEQLARIAKSQGLNVDLTKENLFYTYDCFQFNQYVYTNLPESYMFSDEELVKFSDFISQKPEEKRELKAGMFVRCIDPCYMDFFNRDTLTVDKWYMVNAKTKTIFSVIDDMSDNHEFDIKGCIYFDLLNPSPTNPNSIEPARSPEHVYDPVASMNIGSVCTSMVKEKVHTWNDADMKAAYRAGKK